MAGVGALAAQHDLGALLERIGDVGLDLDQGGLLDQRPDVRAVVEGVADVSPANCSASLLPNSSARDSCTKNRLAETQV